MDDRELDDLEPTYELFEHRTGPLRLLLPVAVLLVVIAIVSGLVFGGVLQGHEVRSGPSGAPTTQPTVLITP